MQQLLQWLREQGAKLSPILRSLLYYARKYIHELELICDEAKLKRSLIVLSTSEKQILEARIDIWDESGRRVLYPSEVTVSLTALPQSRLQVQVEW